MNDEKPPYKVHPAFEPLADDAAFDPAHAESPKPSDKRLRRRGVLLIPNLITTAALFAGFYAIVAGMNGQFVFAALAMLAAALLDTADGRVARMMHSESPFGAEYDSLSDMVAFGVAPGLVAFSWGLSSLGKIGWMVTFLYVACAALRLARFNTSGDNKSFTGLASPAAACIIACTMWWWGDNMTTAPSQVAAGLVGACVAIAALLMVSPFEYYSPKTLKLKDRVPFIVFFLIVLGFAVVLLDPPVVLWLLAVAYAASGPVQAAWRWLSSRKTDAADT